jgi:hypothetical protein
VNLKFKALEKNAAREKCSLLNIEMKKKRPLIFLFKICRFQTQIKKSSSLKLIKIFGAIISELRPLMVCFEFRGELFVLFFRKWKLEKNKTFPSWENGSRAYLSFTAGVFAFAVPR